LAELGGKIFQGNAEMQKYAHILSPSKILQTQLPPDLDAKADMTWLKEQTNISIRGVPYSGNLFRVEVLIPAAEGESQSFEATAFAPVPDQEERWGNLPTFLGIGNCLDRIRFAIDPLNTKFHFGALP
jgi:hypothetical protein